MIAHSLARSMLGFALLAPAIGGLTSVTGFFVAYHFDLPIGATDVALLGALYALAALARIVGKPEPATPPTSPLSPR